MKIATYRRLAIAVDVVVDEIPQTHHYDLSNAKVARGRRSSYSQLVHVSN